LRLEAALCGYGTYLLIFIIRWRWRQDQAKDSRF